jgi:alpha-N-arabinofuranosidase
VQVSEYARGKVLKTLVHSPLKVTKSYGEVPAVQSVLLYDDVTEEIILFALNTFEDEPVEYALDLRSFGKVTFLEHSVIDGSDINAKNSFESPDNVIPRQNSDVPVVNNRGEVSVVLPKLSWNMLRLSVEG